jgi:hypothetical protein
MIRLLLAFALLWTLQAVAVAHKARSGMPYDPYCYNGSDCAEISDEAVTATPNVYLVTLRKGEHPMIESEKITRVIPFKDVRHSEDARFHLCLYPNEDYVRCFYAPPQGF